MVLEAVMVCIDNSEFARNGDHGPTRLHAQNEAANVIAQYKTNDNPETDAGVLSMAGKRVAVIATPSRELGRIMTGLSKVVPEGTSNFLRGLKTAQLALKNRQNKNQRQRIILFVGSPVQDDKKEFVKLGKKLKKNNVAVDVVNLGTENQSNGNIELLTEFVEAVNSSDNSHFINVPHGELKLQDVILSSPIISGGVGGFGAGMDAHMADAGAGAGGAAGDDGFPGLDPTLQETDPELYMVLRASMEEARAAQQAAAAGAGAGAGAGGDGDAAGGAAAMDLEMDDDALLQQAIAMSMAAQDEMGDGDNEEEQDVSMPDAVGASAGGDGDSAASGAGTSAATAASPSSGDAGAAEAQAASGNEQDLAMADASFIESLLDSVGVSKDEVDLDDIVGSLTGDKDKDKNKNKDKDKDKDN